MFPPLISYIVLSYNYEEYIGGTLKSILSQTIDDFEILVVDDASSDQSCDVVRGFNDPRIRLIQNDCNLGGAGSYNVAVEAAQGQWLVNLDADDWITPDKSERQLAAAKQHPEADIIATWVDVVDSNGQPHPDRLDIEQWINIDRDLNLLDSWIGINHICRSSTMIRRDAHLRIGLDDIGMSAAPDYELWTRALAAGCRFHVMQDRLTFMRRHGRGVTFANPLRTFLEVCFIFNRNLLPLAEQRALWPSYLALLQWAGSHAELPNLPARERERLFGIFATRTVLPNYAAFRTAISTNNPELESVGRPALVLAQHLKTRDDWWWLIVQREAKSYQAAIGARDYYKEQSDSWEMEAQRLTTVCKNLEQKIATMPAAPTAYGSSYKSDLVQLLDTFMRHVLGRNK